MAHPPDLIMTEVCDCPVILSGPIYLLPIAMCSFRVRVHNCGHYHKTLKRLCRDAKSKKKVCESGTTEDASTSGTPHCGLHGCDQKPQLKREGPGS